MATMKYPAYIEENWDRLRDAVKQIDADIFSEDAVDAMGEIEDIIRGTIEEQIAEINKRANEAIGYGDVLNIQKEIHEKIDHWFRAIIRDIAHSEELSLVKNLGEDRGTIDDLLDIIGEKIEEIKNLNLTTEEVLKRLGIESRALPRQIIPSDDIGGIIPGNGEGVKEKPELGVNKIALFVDFLKRNGVYTDHMVAFTGKNEPNVMRESSYVLFVIPGLKKGVFVNVDYGEATFVVDMEQVDDNPKRILFLSKLELQSISGTKRIIFSEYNIGDWEGKLQDALFVEGDEIPRVEKRSKAKMREYLEETMAMDAEYFNNKENVLYDLTEFAKAAFKREFIEDTDWTTLGMKRVIDLSSTSSNASARAVCSNGDDLSLQVYLKRAKKFLGKERMLDKLKEIAGYKLMDAEYFNDEDRVREDLKRFAMNAFKIDENRAEEKIIDLGSSNELARAVCCNGEELSLASYLRRATDFLEKKRILDKLKEIAGYELMDAEYFNDRDTVKRDLRKFAVDAFKEKFKEDTDWITLGGKRIIDLSANYKSAQAVFSNGEELSLAGYMYRAAKFLGDKGVLNKLKEIAGYKLMDAEYFNDEDRVREDLKRFAMNAFKIDENRAEEKIIDLSRRDDSARAVCTNGKELSLQGYLYGVGKIFSKTRSEPVTGGEVLIKLKELCLGTVVGEEAIEREI